LVAELPDADGLGPDLNPLPDSFFEYDTPQRGNPVFGPVFVRGARPTDALKLQFLNIEPNRNIARTLLAPDHGLIPDSMLQATCSTRSRSGKPTHLYLWEIRDGSAHIVNTIGDKPVSIPIHPFLGCVSTVSSGTPPLGSLLANNHGGNIDHPDLTAGSTLWLPVSVEGGMLYLGDMHAAQGHGEAAGGGLEISGTATIRVELCKGISLTGPRYRTRTGSACLGIGKCMATATKLAIAEMTRWAALSGWNLYDASMMVNQTCELRIGAVTTEYAVVSCFLGDDKLHGNPLAWD
jgi:acetamidase/formamidase